MTTNFTIPFIKGHGCLNTFIVFDLINSPQYYTDNFINHAHRALLEQKCDDALILLPTKKTDNVSIPAAHMEVLEPDGSFASFCGNGARVVTAYFEQVYGPGNYSLHSRETVRATTAHDNGSYSISMGKTMFNANLSEFVVDSNNVFRSTNDVLWHTVFCELPEVLWYFTQTGEPHLVTFDEITDEQLSTLGLTLNSNIYRTLFPLGININAVTVNDHSSIQVRTFERGVNRITMACGTGSTSCAVLAHTLGLTKNSQIKARNNGGTMIITYDSPSNESIMYGPATLEFKYYELVF